MAGFFSELFNRFVKKPSARRKASRADAAATRAEDTVHAVLPNWNEGDLDALMARRLTELESAMAQLARAQLTERKEREQLVSEIETLRKPVEAERPPEPEAAFSKE
jgi:hypothetical protein